MTAGNHRVNDVDIACSGISTKPAPIPESRDMPSFLHDIANTAVAGMSITNAAAITATANGSGVDLLKADGEVTAVIQAGVITDGTHTITFQESNDNGVSDAYTAIAIMIVTPAALTSSAGGSAVTFGSFLRTKRYVRAVTTVSGASSGGYYSVAILEQQKFIAN